MINVTIRSPIGQKVFTTTLNNHFSQFLTECSQFYNLKPGKFGGKLYTDPNFYNRLIKSSFDMNAKVSQFISQNIVVYLNLDNRTDLDDKTDKPPQSPQNIMDQIFQQSLTPPLTKLCQHVFGGTCQNCYEPNLTQLLLQNKIIRPLWNEYVTKKGGQQSRQLQFTLAYQRKIPISLVEEQCFSFVGDYAALNFYQQSFYFIAYGKESSGTVSLTHYVVLSGQQLLEQTQFDLLEQHGLQQLAFGVVSELPKLTSEDCIRALAKNLPLILFCRYHNQQFSRKPVLNKVVVRPDAFDGIVQEAFYLNDTIQFLYLKNQIDDRPSYVEDDYKFRLLSAQRIDGAEKRQIDCECFMTPVAITEKAGNPLCSWKELSETAGDGKFRAANRRRILDFVKTRPAELLGDPQCLAALKTLGVGVDGTPREVLAGMREKLL